MSDHGTWKVALSVVTGRAHVDQGAPCEDAASVERQDGAIAVCVCDGAGSARHAVRGAHVVARATAQLLCDAAARMRLAALNSADVIAHLRTAILAEAHPAGHPMPDYACTVLAVAVGSETALAIHLGDGVIAAIHGSTPRAIFTPDNGKFANETVFVTSVNAVERLRMQTVPLSPDLAGFALMTDGAAHRLYSRANGSVSRVVGEMAAWLDTDGEAETSASVTYNVRKYISPATHDDCTLALLRAPATGKHKKGSEGTQWQTSE